MRFGGDSDGGDPRLTALENTEGYKALKKAQQEALSLTSVRDITHHHSHMYICTSIYVCLFVCMYVCVYVFQYLRVCMFVHIHTQAAADYNRRFSHDADIERIDYNKNPTPSLDLDTLHTIWHTEFDSKDGANDGVPDEIPGRTKVVL